jgi:hypothetical protein
LIPLAFSQKFRLLRVVQEIAKLRSMSDIAILQQ